MFIAIPVGMNYRTERLPVVTLSLIGANTLIWLVSAICFLATDGQSDLWIYQHLWLTPASCTWFAPLTSMFVHAGIFHLLGNMIFLFLFGSCVEDLIGRSRFLAFYLVGGLVAEMVYIGMSPDHFQSMIPMGGASGAISACMGMYLLLRADADIEFKYFIWFFLIYMRAGEFEVPAWVVITFWFGKDLLFAILSMFLGSGHGGGVAFGAHVGGFLGGLALVFAYQRIAKPRSHAESESGPETKLEPERKRGPIIDTAQILSASACRRPESSESSDGEVPAIFLYDADQQTGPFTLTQVQAMLRRGEVSPRASYWSDGMAGWQSVADLAGQPMG